MEKTTMTKKNKHIQQFKSAQSGITLLYNEAKLINDYEELQTFLNVFFGYFQRIANEKNTAPNKSLIAFKSYYENEAQSKRTAKAIQSKAKAKRLSYRANYKDYISEYMILRKRNYSYRAISEYSKLYLKVSVSKDTLRKYLKEVENNDT